MVWKSIDERIKQVLTKLKITDKNYFDFLDAGGIELNIEKNRRDIKKIIFNQKTMPFIKFQNDIMFPLQVENVIKGGKQKEAFEVLRDEGLHAFKAYLVWFAYVSIYTFILLCIDKNTRLDAKITQK